MIKILRSFLCGICFFIFGLGSIVIGSAVFPIILLVYKSEKQRKIFANTIYVSWRVFIWLICSLRLIKLNCPVQKQLKSVHGTIVIANHPSLIDVVILVSRIPNSICVVKESLFKNIFVRKVIGNTYLSNTMTPKEFIARGKDILSKGYNIVIFPEGTRTVPNKPIHLHRGFAHLQIETGADILPIHITNTPSILGKTQKWWNIGEKPSVYDIISKPKISYNGEKIQDKRKMAMDITNRAKSLLF